MRAEAKTLSSSKPRLSNEAKRKKKKNAGTFDRSFDRYAAGRSERVCAAYGASRGSGRGYNGFSTYRFDVFRSGLWAGSMRVKRPLANPIEYISRKN